MSAANYGAQLKTQRAHTVATILFAMLKCCKVMDKFLEKKFKAHDSVVAERTRLLFNNLSKNDGTSASGGNNALSIAKAAQSTADKVEQKLKDEVKKLQDKIDKKQDR
jgi:translation initiation factor 2B subunit (eIF-2B alpha/beta/delta family)